MGDEDMRFSDQQLIDFKRDFVELKQEFMRHKDEENERWDRVCGLISDLSEGQRRNTEAIAEATKSIDAVVRSTKDIVQIYTDIQGAARLEAGLRRIIVSISKWGFIGLGIASILTYAVEWIAAHWRA